MIHDWTKMHDSLHVAASDWLQMRAADIDALYHERNAELQAALEAVGVDDYSDRDIRENFDLQGDGLNALHDSMLQVTGGKITGRDWPGRKKALSDTIAKNSDVACNFDRFFLRGMLYGLTLCDMPIFSPEIKKIRALIDAWDAKQEQQENEA